MNTISYILGKFLMACRVGGLTVNTSKFTVTMFFSKEPIDIIHGSRHSNNSVLSQFALKIKSTDGFNDIVNRKRDIINMKLYINIFL